MTTTHNSLISLFILIFISGCAHIEPTPQDFDPGSNVTAIETPYTSALSCMGTLIDKNLNNPIYVKVHKIRDETIPEEFRSRGLTGGGKWLAATAITRLDSQNVTAVLAKHHKKSLSDKDRAVIEFRGAFTQFDRINLSAGIGLETIIRKWGLDISGSKTYELVTGDFTTSYNGEILHANAVGALVMSHSNEGAVFFDDGDETVAISLNANSRDGKQNAQRHIIEAAIMSHIASFYGVKYKSCINEERFISLNNSPISQDSNSIKSESCSSEDCIQYTVQAGDELFFIVKNNTPIPYNEALPTIFQLNPALTDPNKLEVGQKIWLPK